MPDMKLFAGNAVPELAQKVADRLYTKLGNASVGRFSDGEISVEIHENVRGSDVFIIQSTCAPTNDNLMELDRHDRRTTSRFCWSYYSRNPLFRLCYDKIVVFVQLVFQLQRK